MIFLHCQFAGNVDFIADVLIAASANDWTTVDMLTTSTIARNAHIASSSKRLAL
jgi:hypothetical protein